MFKKEINLRDRIVSAILVLVMSLTSFIGTTFAWFTDSVTSGSNVIKPGNLDANMYYSDELLDVSDSNWKNADGVAVFNHQNWEPGYTEVKYVKIENAGDLAFKWMLSIEAGGEVGILADVIDVYYVNPVNAELESLDGLTSSGNLSDVIAKHTSTNGVILPKGKTEPGLDTGAVVLAIAMHMQESAGNKYQDETVCDEGFLLKLVATQYNFEKDSYDESFDKDATWDDITSVGSVNVPVTINDAGELTATVTGSFAGGAATYTLPAGMKFKPGTTEATVSISNLANESNLSIENGEERKSIDVHVDGVADDNTVAAVIEIGEALPKGLNLGNYKLYHFEEGVANQMMLASLADVDAHNEFAYDPVTGNVTVAMATYSEVALVADTENAWNGTYATSFAGGAGTEADPYIIANADQLAYLGEVISNDNENYGDKFYKLVSNINLGGEDNANNGIIFYPIGYHKVGGNIATIGMDDAPEFIYFDDNYDGADYANGRGASVAADDGTTPWYTYGGAFKGTFDGNGNTISNIYQNTWQMKGDYDGHYWNDAMGIFGYVYGGTVKNLTVNNFSSDGEFTPTGVIAAYAAGNSTFENIAITNCNPRVYNTGNGGIVGVGGSSSETNETTLTFTNITVDNTNKISALWGSWDVACGGIMGMFRGYANVELTNCHIGAQIDVYNDVCGNYQYYWYRYAGMVIGSLRGRNTTDANGYTVPNMTGIVAKDCTVHFGTWNDYYYCELVANSLASYTHDHQFSRLTVINSLDEIKSGDEWTKTGNFLLNGECYHIVKDGDVIKRHLHEDAGYETVNGESVLKEDKQVVYLPFNQLFQGDGWGVKTIGFRNDAEYNEELYGVRILDREEANSISKFESVLDGNEFETGTTLTLGEIFAAVVDSTKINTQTLKVFVSPVGESTVSAVYTPDSNWANGTITFNGIGAAKIVITDYTYCKETVATVIIEAHEHVYDNACDTTCNACGAERIVEHNYEALETAPTCTEAGYTTYTCACGDTYTGNEVPARGHSYNTVVTEPTCTTGGYTTYTCETCGHTYTGNETESIDHNYKAVVTAPTCTEEGYTTYTCACGDTYTADKVAALGHKYNAVVTAPTCTEAGYTTYTCSCGDTYTADEVAALGHITTNFKGNFLYRVGNQNAVQLSSLFSIGKHNVEVNGANVSGNASVTVNGTTLKFNETGIVKVTLASDCTCNECELELTLEVIDAVNATGATSATSNNVVLLNDCGFGSLEVSGGYTLYGNGFTMTCGSDGYAIDRTYSFVDLKGGTIDNVKIIVPNFSHAIMYEKNKTEGGNPSNTDSNGRTRYYNIRSAIVVNGSSKITNSYISGGRAAIYTISGTLTLENTTVYGGAVANIQAEANSALVLRDVTLIQKPIKANVNDTSKILMGFSVLMMCDTNGVGAPVILEGYLHQYAWANKDYKSYVPSDGQDVVDEVLSQTEYVHSIKYDDGKTRDSVNLGFAYMPDGITTTNADNMNDNRSSTEQSKLPYGKLTIKSVAAIYTHKNTNGTAAEVSKEPSYESTKQGIIIPSVKYNDVNENRVFSTSFDAAENCWKATLKVDVDAGAYSFTFAKLLAQKFGNNLSYTIKTKDDVSIDKNTVITLNSAVSNIYILTITDDKIYDKDGNDTEETVQIKYIFELLSTKTSLPAPTWTSTTLNGTPYIVVDSKDGDWNCAVPVLDGLKVKYWSKKQNKEIELDLANIVTAAGLSKGLQNGSNNTITITVADEYTITITTSGFKTNDNGKPVVVNSKLYFTVASSSNYVSTKTTDRTVGISYTFTDANNSESIELSTSMSVVYATYKSKQYKYSDFCNGTLSEASCVTPDTLITLADGSQVRVDSLTGNEMLLVWNMETGKFDVAPIMFVDSDPTAEYEIIHLYFSDGTDVKVIYEHGFWDYDLNRYVYLDKDAADYIGHTFAKQNGDKLDKVQLVDVVIETEVTEAWSPVTAGHLCYFVNGMLSMPGGVGGLFNIFEVDPETMTYDYEAIEKDIETYGLYTYEELNALCPLSEKMFVEAGGAYLKISIGKGNLTEEELFNMINRYSKFFE